MRDCSNVVLNKIELVESFNCYEKFKNWVVGEFDLFLKKEESEEMTVYFPNGRFIIRCINNTEECNQIEILVIGKSHIICEKIMSQLQVLFSHVVWLNH